jgi:hypothetical protein
MNTKAPQILNDIVEALKGSNLKAITENNEGRVNSKQDEDQIIAWLKAQPRFAAHIKEGQLRGFGDMTVTDAAGVDHVVNIKTSIGSSDNAFSKLGILWALTDLTIEDYRELKIANKISDKKFAELVIAHKCNTDRDYWFLSLDKNDFSHVMIRGVKQIVNWGKNPTNNLQIAWAAEHLCVARDDDFDTVFNDVITDGVFKCWAMKADQWLAAIRYREEELNAHAE